MTSRALVVAVLLVAMFAGAVVTQAIVERRTPTQVFSGYFIPAPQSYFNKDRVAMLMLGIDYNYDSKDQEFSTNARSDTIKAVSLNLPTAQNPAGAVSILSIPRDTDFTWKGHEDKINSVYSGYRDNRAASRATEDAVASFLGLAGFDRYLTLRINATKELIDAIGGIDVVPDETMNYDDSWGHLHIHFIGGKKYHMNGEQAVSYSRFRHDACSDPCRIKRQDQVLKLALAKLKNDKLNDLVHINALIDVVRRNVYTDLSPPEMLSLAWAFQHIDPSTIVTQQVPFTTDKTLACCGSVLVPDDAAKAKLVRTAFVDPPVVVASPDARLVRQVVPSSVHVVVQNGSGISGQGARVAEALRKAGFVIDGIVNADSFTHDATEIRVHSTMSPLAGERVRSALAIKTATVHPEAATPSAAPEVGDVTVIVGRDYATGVGNASAVK